MRIKLFGFELGKAEVTNELVRSPVPEAAEDGAVHVFGSTYGTSMAFDGSSLTNENELIMEYRECAMNPEVAVAVEEITNSLINATEKGSPIKLNLDGVKTLSTATKKQVLAEWDAVCNLFQLNSCGQGIAYRWYVDGRIFYHKLIDENRPEDGIRELRYIDPRKIKRVVEILPAFQRQPDQFSQINVRSREYYVYNDIGINSGMSSAFYITAGSAALNNLNGVYIAKDAVVQATSGMLDVTGQVNISHLHIAMRSANLMRMLEEGMIIYRIARAPERRIFKPDVGDMPRAKSDQYVQDLMAKFKTKLVFDVSTGKIKDNKRNLAITEDFWLPTRNGRGIEIDTLPGGQAQGIMDELESMRQKLMRALKVPMSRLDQSASMQFGATATEITREELRFAKFIRSLRGRLNDMFLDVLRTQLHLKNIMTTDEFDGIVAFLRLVYQEDNIFEELKQAEMIRNKLNTLTEIAPFVGTYFSKEYVDEHVLHITEEERAEMTKQIEAHKKTDPEGAAALAAAGGQMPPEPQIDGNPFDTKDDPEEKSTDLEESMMNLFETISNDIRSK